MNEHAHEKIKTILSAVKRAKSMGKQSGLRDEYLSHFLAPSIDNNTRAIDGAVEALIPVRWPKDACAELLMVNYCIYYMSARINLFCDNNRVVGDIAAQYWLWIFYNYATSKYKREVVSTLSNLINRIK